MRTERALPARGQHSVKARLFLDNGAWSVSCLGFLTVCLRSTRTLHSHISSLGVEVSGEVGGVFLKCEDFGRMFDSSFPACAFFSFTRSFFFFGGGVEISSRILIPVFRPGSVHSGSTS